MKIKNFDDLASNQLRKDALMIIEAGLAAIDTRSVLLDSVRLENNQICIHDTVCSLNNTERVFVLGVGKCSIEAAVVLEDILGGRITGGLVFDVAEPEHNDLKRIDWCVGTHPFPSDQNIEYTRKMISMLSGLTERDLVIVIVSGGGSTLLCNPEEGMSCVDEKNILRSLFAAGATIQEINTIRKHTSYARGGFLAKYAYPAQVMSLVFSDVPGKDAGMVASGPTMKDTSTVEDADEILLKYDVLNKCNMKHCGLIETPKDDKYFAHVTNVLVVSNKLALDAMHDQAVALGYATELCTNCLAGEARNIGGGLITQLGNAAQKTALLYGGETTVTVVGSGNGGRNQELALGALKQVDEGKVVLSINSDGRDNGEYAGAIADVSLKAAYEELGLDPDEYLKQNNSTEFFKQINGLVITGSTGSNVADLIVALKE